LAQRKTKQNENKVVEITSENMKMDMKKFLPLAGI